MVELKRNDRWHFLANAIVVWDAPGIALVTVPADHIGSTSGFMHLTFRIDGRPSLCVLSMERRRDTLTGQHVSVFRVLMRSSAQGLAAPSY